MLAPSAPPSAGTSPHKWDKDACTDRRRLFCDVGDLAKSSMTACFSPLAGRRCRQADERLSEVSSCICELDARIACFCIEDDEQFAGERDADDHLFLAGLLQPLMEGSEVRIVPGDDAGNEEEDDARSCAATAHRSAASALAAVVGQRRQADQLGDGLVGEDADL